MIILKKAFVISVCALVLSLPVAAQEQEDDATTTQSIEKRMETRRGAMEQRRIEFEGRVEQTREDLTTRIEKKREELKERLQGIRDENKRKIVERIDRQMDALNKRLLKHFEAVLNKLEGILSRIGDRADRAESNGSDVSAKVKPIKPATNDSEATSTPETEGEE